MTNKDWSSIWIAISVAIISGVFALLSSIGAPLTEWFLEPKTSSSKKQSDESVQLKKVKTLSFTNNVIFLSTRTGTIRSIEDGDTLHSGDLYKIIFTPDQDSYVYIYQLDSSGQIYQLFPMKEFKGVKVNNFNPVRKDTRYVIPSPNKAFKLDNNVGKERIYFVASRTPDEQLEDAYSNALNARQENGQFANVSKKRDRDFIIEFKKRGIESIVTDRSVSLNWHHEAKEQDFSIFEQRLDDVCIGCYYSITFNHI